MLGPEIELNLPIPDQTLTSLSFADSTPTAIRNWVHELPMANVGETSRQLYQAIIELNQLVVAPHIRSQMLETIRGPIHYICKELSKHFLNQSVTLPAKQQKVANLTHAMQIHLATGYKVVMVDSLIDMAHEKTRKNFACAAHRMMSEYGEVLLRSNQLYSVAPKNIWQEMHEVFKFSETIDLFKYAIKDEHNRTQSDTRIDQAYKRNLLLACCRPNQLRQHDILTAYELFGEWSDYVEVGSEYSGNSVFVINMAADLPPRYRSLLQDTLTDHYYGFDTAELVSRLNSHFDSIQEKNSSGVSYISLPVSASEQLLHHFHHAFGILTKRSFKRISNSGTLHLCIGLSASHYYTSGETEFHIQMLEQSNTSKSDGGENIFMAQARQQSDAWSQAHDAGGNKENPRSPLGESISFSRSVHNEEKPYPEYETPLVNTSPGGYCLQWNDEIPGNVQAGEVIAVRESKSQPWSIAVIRWLRHSKQKGTQIGIELLAPNGRPCGVQLLQKTGAPSEFLRGMLLHEITAIGQPATLITPRLPFQTGHKINIRMNGQETKCQLDRQVTATASFSQFELSQSVGLKEMTANTAPDAINEKDADDEFDSLWPSL